MEPENALLCSEQPITGPCYESVEYSSYPHMQKQKNRGLSPRVNYTDRATAACRQC
jgi:hypothetical protein